jgi:hypothetical protein
MARKDTHAVLEMPADKIDAARAALKTLRPGLRVMSAGDTIEIYKEVGPAQGRGRPVQPFGHDAAATASATPAWQPSLP